MAARAAAPCSLARAASYHDLGLIAFGLALRERGWRIAFLGANTPVESLRSSAEATLPDAIVLFSLSPELYEGSGGRPVER